MRLLGKRVGVVQLDRVERSPGGLWLPSKTEVSQEGIVQEVGEEVKLDIKIGDRVLFDKYSGMKISRVGQRDLVILNEDDITCKVEVK